MRISGFRERLLSGAPLAGTFVKTPSHMVVEVLARSTLDFVCLDAEHSPFDRSAIDACCAVAHALDFPVVVRVQDGSAHQMLSALDSGAAGIVVPHVSSVEKARAVAKAARYGPGGRGFAGATRWADWGGHGMGALIERSRQETVVMVQIEEPEGVEACADIAGVDGVDALFVGPSDLSVGYGLTQLGSPELDAAMRRVGDAVRAAGRAYVSWVPDANKIPSWSRDYGVTAFLVASELGWMRQGADAAAAGVHGLGSGG